jgi:hypothetical protein
VEAELIGQLATWLGRPAATWRVTTLAKSMELPHGPINMPLLVKVDTHTTLWRFHLQSSPFIVVARHSLVGRVVRL